MHIDTRQLESLVTAAHAEELRQHSIAGLNLLSACVHARRQDLAHLLVERGFPIDANNPGWVTSALSEAAQLADGQFVRLLLQWGANPNGHCTEDTTPLHRAVCDDNIELARELLVAGANSLAQDLARRTPRELIRSKAMRALLDAFPGAPNHYGDPIGTYRE